MTRVNGVPGEAACPNHGLENGPDAVVGLMACVITGFGSCACAKNKGILFPHGVSFTEKRSGEEREALTLHRIAARDVARPRERRLPPITRTLTARNIPAGVNSSPAAGAAIRCAGLCFKDCFLSPKQADLGGLWQPGDGHPAPSCKRKPSSAWGPDRDLWAGPRGHFLHILRGWVAGRSWKTTLPYVRFVLLHGSSHVCLT
ncbi:uncharacterized protein LOC123643583 [Lemur catta]|uniref:uncharacterized protein LOC123643583 n=1 Tax=Lemur catta TaxID=9447 RepID=UPI001E26C1AD|nr:uncharacterized protein LOC123643583 [Lemur catta]